MVDQFPADAVGIEIHGPERVLHAGFDGFVIARVPMGGEFETFEIFLRIVDAQCHHQIDAVAGVNRIGLETGTRELIPEN